jgi:hypothetical protein
LLSVVFGPSGSDLSRRFEPIEEIEIGCTGEIAQLARLEACGVIKHPAAKGDIPP